MGLISRISAEQRILPFLVLHLCLMIEIHGFRYREHCWRGHSVHLLPALAFSVQAKLTGIGEISFALYKFIKFSSVVLGASQGKLWLNFRLLCSSKLSGVTKALNQDLQLGPGEPIWASFVMECRESHCSLSRSI